MDEAVVELFQILCLAGGHEALLPSVCLSVPIRSSEILCKYVVVADNSYRLVLDRVHNSRHAGRAAPSRWAASQRSETAPHGCIVATFCTFWPCDLWPFDLILIGGRGTVMDYPCANFGDFSFSRFGFIVRTDRQNHRGGSTLYSRDYRRRE